MGRKKSKLDHAGRSSDHPRYGNPSDPTKEASRIRGAYENVDKWQRKYGAELSGGVSISYGDGPAYNVPIGNPEIAQKIVSRPISAPAEGKSLPEPAESAPEPPPLSPIAPRQFWLWRLINRITGAFR